MIQDRKLTMLGLALLAATILLYYYVPFPGDIHPAYATGLAMVAVFLVVFVRFNLKFLGR